MRLLSCSPSPSEISVPVSQVDLTVLESSSGARPPLQNPDNHDLLQLPPIPAAGEHSKFADSSSNNEDNELVNTIRLTQGAASTVSSIASLGVNGARDPKCCSSNTTS